MTGVLTLNNSESYKLQIITKFLSGKLYKDEAALLLNVSERPIVRYAKKIRDLGPAGAKHGNSGKSKNRKWSHELIQEIIDLKINEYFDFNTAHFVDLLKSKHKIDIPYGTVWEWLRERKLVKNPRRRRRKSMYIAPECLRKAYYYKWMDVVISLTERTTGCLYR